MSRPTQQPTQRHAGLRCIALQRMQLHEATWHPAAAYVAAAEPTLPGTAPFPAATSAAAGCSMSTYVAADDLRVIRPEQLQHRCELPAATCHHLACLIFQALRASWAYTIQACISPATLYIFGATSRSPEALHFSKSGLLEPRRRVDIHAYFCYSLAPRPALSTVQVFYGIVKRLPTVIGSDTKSCIGKV